MTEHYTKKIQNVIQAELFKASRSIKIVVAWFTNDLLFQPLLMKLQVGVSVEIILNKDDINDSASNEIDFKEFVRLGGILRWNETKQLLHDKFCIIDERVVITGSYNWTNKAEYNNEIITLFIDEEETSSFYLKIFNQLSDKYQQEKCEIENRPSDIPKCPEPQSIHKEIPQQIESSSLPWPPEKVVSSDSRSKRLIPELPELEFYDEIEFSCKRKKESFSIFAKYTHFYKTSFHDEVIKEEKRICILNDSLNSPWAGFHEFLYSDDALWLRKGSSWSIYKLDEQNSTLYQLSPGFTWANGQKPSNGYNILPFNGKYGIVFGYDAILGFEYDNIVMWRKNTKGCWYDYAILEKEGLYGLYYPSSRHLYPCKYTIDEVKEFANQKQE